MLLAESTEVCLRTRAPHPRLGHRQRRSHTRGQIVFINEHCLCVTDKFRRKFRLRGTQRSDCQGWGSGGCDQGVVVGDSDDRESEGGVTQKYK